MIHAVKEQLTLKLKCTSWVNVTNITNIMQVWFHHLSLSCFSVSFFTVIAMSLSQSLPSTCPCPMYSMFIWDSVPYSCNGFSDSDARLLPPPPTCCTRRSEVALTAHSGIHATLCVMSNTGHSCLPPTSSQSHNHPQLLLFQHQARPPFKAHATLARSSWFQLQEAKLIEIFI